MSVYKIGEFNTGVDPSELLVSIRIIFLTKIKLYANLI